MQTLIYNKNSDKARVDRNISRRYRQSLPLMVLLVVCLLLLVVLPAPTPDEAAQLNLPLNQADAMNRAIAIAPEYGIDIPKPSKILAVQMTLGEWNKLVGNISGPEAAKFGLDPNQLVWVVTLIGDGFWAESNPSGQGGDAFDNITLVIGAATGRHIETRVLAPADSLPFGN
jgi:hypothetical protein